MSDRRFLAPLIAETRRRIAGDGLPVAEPGSIERKTGNFSLARTTFLQTLEPNPTGSPRPMMFMHTSPANSIRPGRHSSATCPAQCPGV